MPMTPEQRQAYRDFCHAFNISMHTLGVAFIAANRAFKFDEVTLKDYGTMAAEQVEKVAKMMDE